MFTEQLSLVGPKDVVVAVISPYAREVVELVELGAQRKARQIAITDSQVSPLAAFSDVCFVVREAQVDGFRSQVASLCLAQTLAVSLALNKAGMQKRSSWLKLLLFPDGDVNVLSGLLVRRRRVNLQPGRAQHWGCGRIAKKILFGLNKKGRLATLTGLYPQPMLIVARIIRAIDPRVILFPGKHPFAIRAGHHVQIVAVISGNRRHRMVAARHHDHIVVVGRHAGIEAAVIGVDALEGKALRRIETVIVGLFQLGFRPAAPYRAYATAMSWSPFLGVNLHHQQAVRLRAIRQNIVHQRWLRPSAMLYAHVLRGDDPCRESSFTRRAAYRQLV
jgi:hypothetical protein